jgi:hypothetical protein
MLLQEANIQVETLAEFIIQQLIDNTTDKDNEEEFLPLIIGEPAQFSLPGDLQSSRTHRFQVDFWTVS